MKKLQILTAAAGILLARAGPSLAAQRTHRGVDAYASGDVSADRSGAYYYGPRAYGAQPLTPAQHQYSRSAPYAGQNLPYADRPYGDPDSW
jgi:hypothetical protein